MQFQIISDGSVSETSGYSYSQACFFESFSYGSLVNIFAVFYFSARKNPCVAVALNKRKTVFVVPYYGNDYLRAPKLHKAGILSIISHELSRPLVVDRE
jgi:hypothetical protein